MNQTSEWICKLSSLREFTRAEQADLNATVGELDRIQSENGVECEAIHCDLLQLVNYY